MIIGYARVSTEDQHLTIQLEKLAAAGATKIFQEKISGARSDRPELHAMLEHLQPGDTLLVTRLDRLARSTLDLLSILKRISDGGVQFKSLADTWADTTTPHGRLMLTILGGLAEFERELIKARTTEGRIRAREQGVKFGRPKKVTPALRNDILSMLKYSSVREVAQRLGLSVRTIKRIHDGSNNSDGTLQPGSPGLGPHAASQTFF